VVLPGIAVHGPALLGADSHLRMGPVFPATVNVPVAGEQTSDSPMIVPPVVVEELCA